MQFKLTINRFYLNTNINFIATRSCCI